MVHDLQNWNDEMIVPNPDQDDSDEAEGTTLRDPQYTNSRGRPRLNRYRGRIEYYFTSSQPRGVFGASNGARTSVRGGGRGGGRIGGNRGGRGVGRSGGRRSRGNGQGRGTNIEHDGYLGVNGQIDSTQSQSSLFDLNAEPDLEL
ncbi:PREDICTED: rRNA 2'-O-methyltransferase fibrillarin-like [Nicotiana attenuata]|uniref:rRNA 2'-O-methyltransferase fibrillarin-like n=1 Tax=Nicotiana attenuata TaxID=49451 RepID=UPI0009049AF7|nr:PREDICTED: rRNA 2'-O-methyltransferase fibrillarin-like [Nicotiana attenuata]